MRFITPLVLVAADDDHEWLLDQHFVIYITSNDSTITVPKGFVTDLASIPSVFRWLPGMSPTGSSRKAAVLHDYLYAIQDRSRAQADDLFLTALEACDVSWLVRRAMYVGVRAGGWVAWNSRAKARDADPAKYWAETGLEARNA